MDSKRKLNRRYGRKAQQRTRKPRIYVAVVYKLSTDDPFASARPNKSYECFIGVDYLKVTAQALEARQHWGSAYRILTGILDTEVAPAREYTFSKLEGLP